MDTNTNLIEPGAENQPAGDYTEVDEEGNEVEPENTVTINKGDSLPPTREAGNKWKRV